MVVQTKYLGEIDIEEDKIITFEHGIFGFEECTRYILLYKDEFGSGISWLQSLDNEALALPVISPSLVMKEYNPVVEDEVLNTLGQMKEDNIVIFLTLTVPADLTKMTSNLKAPLVINAETKKGCQVVAENQEYLIKYPVYEVFSKKNKEKGEITC